MADERFLIPSRHSGPDQLSDDGLLRIASGEPEEEPHAIDVAHAKNINPTQWGNQFNISAIGGSVVPLLTTPPFPTETDCTLVLQVTSFPANCNVQFQITYGIGAASYSKTLLIATVNPKFVFLTARNIQVSAVIVGTPGHSLPAFTPLAATVKVSVAPSNLKLRDLYCWSAYGIPSTNSTGIYQGPGVLGAMHIVLDAVSAAGTPMWLLLFDLDNTGLGPTTTVTKPLPMGVSDTLEDVGDDDSYSGVFLPEGVCWSTGLWAALSSTPDVYTAVSGGNTARIDLVVGS